MHDGEIILIAGALLAGGLFAGMIASGLRVPGLVLVLGLGMLIGSDGTGWIHFDDYHLARSVGIVSLGLILFEGGLTAGFAEIRRASTTRSPSCWCSASSTGSRSRAMACGTCSGGSGFLAVYMAGLALGSVPSPAMRTMATFHEGLAWLAQVAMFLTLGLLVFPSHLGDVWLKGTILAVVATAVARPVATVLVGWPFRFSLGERVVLGWAGLRGAVPVVLATFPVIAGVHGPLGCSTSPSSPCW